MKLIVLNSLIVLPFLVNASQKTTQIQTAQTKMNTPSLKDTASVRMLLQTLSPEEQEKVKKMIQDKNQVVAVTQDTLTKAKL